MIKTVTAEDLLTMNPKPYGLVDDPYNQTRIEGSAERDPDSPEYIFIYTQLGPIRLPQKEYVTIAEGPGDMATSDAIKDEDENGFFSDAEALGRFRQLNATPPVPMIHRNQLPSGDRTLAFGIHKKGITDPEDTEVHIYTHGKTIVMRWIDPDVCETITFVAHDHVPANLLAADVKFYPKGTNRAFAQLMSALGHPLELMDFDEYCELPRLVDPAKLHHRPGSL